MKNRKVENFSKKDFSTKTTAFRALYFALLSALMAEHLGLMNRMNDDVVIREGKSDEKEHREKYYSKI